MRARVISAAILAPLAVLLTIAGGVPFLIGVIVLCAIGAWEATALLGRPAGLLPAAPIGEAAPDAPPGSRVPATLWRYLAGGAAAAVLAGVGIDAEHPGAARAVAALVLLVGLLGLVGGGPPARRFLCWACAAASVLYVAGLGAHFILLRGSGQGLQWTLLACAVTWATDIGAFFAGRRYGRRPFFGMISPKKTLEGALGGLAAGTVAGVLVVWLAGLKAPLILAPLIAISLSVVAQLGDLLESLLKREAAVKDSGTIIPGHGGVLDRIDSLLVAVTVAFYWRLLFP